MSPSDGLNTLFAREVESFTVRLEREFSPTIQADIAHNLTAIDSMLGMNKCALEEWLNTAMIISLNDEEFAFIRKKLQALKKANQDTHTHQDALHT